MNGLKGKAACGTHESAGSCSYKVDREKTDAFRAAVTLVNVIHIIFTVEMYKDEWPGTENNQKVFLQ